MPKFSWLNPSICAWCQAWISIHTTNSQHLMALIKHLFILPVIMKRHSYREGEREGMEGGRKKGGRVGKKQDGLPDKAQVFSIQIYHFQDYHFLVRVWRIPVSQIKKLGQCLLETDPKLLPTTDADTKANKIGVREMAPWIRALAR